MSFASHRNEFGVVIVINNNSYILEFDAALGVGVIWSFLGGPVGI